VDAEMLKDAIARVRADMAVGTAVAQRSCLGAVLGPDQIDLVVCGVKTGGH